MNEAAWLLTIIGIVFLSPIIFPAIIVFTPEVFKWLGGFFIAYDTYKVKSVNSGYTHVGYERYETHSIVLDDSGAEITFDSNSKINKRIKTLQEPNKEFDIFITAKLDMKNFKIIKNKGYHLKRKEDKND